MQRLVIGAPFGCYLSFPHSTSTLGTFTARPRGGPWRRLWRAARTIRYYPGIGSWTNRMGLPNPGIDSLRPSWCADKIISVAGHIIDDWRHVLYSAAALHPLAIELNVSCPNCPGEDQSDYAEVFPLAVRVCRPTQLIVKLPPVGYEGLVEQAWQEGINWFHCCNTLHSPGGGISGKPLKPLSLWAVKTLKQRWGQDVTIIGGGGVTHLEDFCEYRRAGADHVSVASVLLNPFAWRRVMSIAAKAGASSMLQYLRPSAGID